MSDVHFFLRSTRKVSYTLWPMESNYLKGAYIQTVHSTEFKLDMYIIGHHWAKAIYFGEFLMHSFFLQEYKKEFLYITAYGVKFFKRF